QRAAKVGRDDLASSLRFLQRAANAGRDDPDRLRENLREQWTTAAFRGTAIATRKSDLAGRASVLVSLVERDGVALVERVLPPVLLHAGVPIGLFEQGERVQIEPEPEVEPVLLDSLAGAEIGTP